MKPISADETSYERFEILGRDALFTNLRIDRKSLPDGLYAYDLRDSDNCDGADEGIVLNEDDYNYLGEDMKFEEFLNSAPKMEQTM